MNELKIFENPEFGQVRTVTIEGEPWFVGKDVAEVLGYKNTQKAISDHVDDEDKLRERIVTSGQNREVIIINESGLHSLVLSSKLPTAKKFKRWVTSEVLPNIRKHGVHMTFEAVDKFLTNPDTLVQIVQNWNKDRIRVNELEAKVEADKPKVIFAEAVETANTTILIGDLAKLLRQNGVEMGQQRMFQWLRDNGYLISRKGTSWNSPAQRSMEMGLFEIKETVVTHNDGHTTVSKTTKVTGKGQSYFINLFLSKTDELVAV